MEFNKLVPELSVSNFNKSLEFYTKILGFSIKYQRNNFAFLSLNGAQLMIEQINNNWSVGELEKPLGRGINFEITIDDATAFAESIKEKNHPLFRDVMENWYKGKTKFHGNKEFLVQDPDGYLLRFAQNLGEKDIKLVS